MPQPPIALAMVVSDAIWTDPGSGKKTILGTFSTIFGTEFPLVMPQIAIYLALTDAEGEVALNLRIVDVDEARAPVWEQEIKPAFPDKIAIAEGVMVFYGAAFPEPGEYRIQLLQDHEIIIERRLLVMSPTEANNG